VEWLPIVNLLIGLFGEQSAPPSAPVILYWVLQGLLVLTVLAKAAQKVAELTETDKDDKALAAIVWTLAELIRIVTEMATANSKPKAKK